MKTTTAVNTDATGLVIRGYDPVAYFTEGRAVPGRPEFSAEFEGGNYLFATAANRDAFATDPGRYAPQYGGYCAYGVAVGKKFDVDAGSWRIAAGRLYFNLNPMILEKWGADQDDYLRRSEENWPQIRDRLPSEL